MLKCPIILKKNKNLITDLLSFEMGIFSRLRLQNQEMGFFSRLSPTRFLLESLRYNTRKAYFSCLGLNCDTQDFTLYYKNV